jgi:DinB superfamily
MDIKTIKSQLLDSHHSFAGFINSLPEEDFLTINNNKWTAGQQLEHIYLGVKPFRQALGLPKFLLRLIWGQANRESKSYEELVKKYVQKLAAGGRATRRFIPAPVNIEKGQQLTIALSNEVNSLCNRLDRFSETDLDKYVLPHPLLGKITIREMLYFTIYHFKHHEEQTKQNLIAK